DHQRLALDAAHQDGGKGRSHYPAYDQPYDHLPAVYSRKYQESGGAGSGDEKFRRVYGANGVMHGAALAQQGGGNNRSPAAAANSIHKTAEKGQGPQALYFGLAALALQRFP